MTTAAKPVKLHKHAPWRTGWDPALCRTYREWFTEVDGRYFRVSAEGLYTWWDLEEITADGAWVSWIAVCVRNLPAVRAAIADVVAGVDLDEVARRASRAPGAPTGRSARKHR
jgi:hypothetical protein